MDLRRLNFLFRIASLLVLPAVSARAGTTNLHTTWLWHMHQPIYWPDRRDYGVDHYENAWDTIQQQNAGRPHPNPEVLSTVFGRSGPRQCLPIFALRCAFQHPELSECRRVDEFLRRADRKCAKSGRTGSRLRHGSGIRTTRLLRSWTTAGGHPRLDLVNFTYHHALAPLISAETLEMELRIHQRQMRNFLGHKPGG